jgi:plasmid maintenance system antidote protein VapI
MNTIQYLDAVKATLDVTSDYALAKALDVSKQAVSRYYNKGGHFDDDVARKVASILGKHPGLVMLDMHRERAQTPETEALWKEIFEGFRAPLLRAKSVQGPALNR